ncbi:transglutaminase family protein [Pseudorhodobacter sp.]|uniref:transglutaminase family protein n=1 Tax=Pseudorhodobacter sp. TaxID=1934400 RepID=UPI0026485515|nr:transglutaminase family protein [Pseudorhodobacter sp.]MDN5788420.1 transglutaminase family protein [Pseudorhodobacter sp.]
MLLTVEHITRYSYSQPVRAVVQSHRLTPSVFDGQKVREWDVTVSDGLRGGSFRDGAGDFVQAWTILGPVSEIEVKVQGRIETTDMTGVLRGHKERVPPMVYLQSTPATLADAAIAELSAAHTGGKAALDLAHALAAAVSDAIAFVPGMTDNATTAAEALSLGKGVCQDHAHALISAARWAGLPARYVSGYLHANNDGTLHDAAHAWAEIWVRDLGWIGLDAANRCSPDARYIRLGSGLDAMDAAPIRGIARSPGTESLDVTVAVQQSGQQ